MVYTVTLMKKLTDKQILDRVAQAIFDKKGFNILVLDVRGISTMTDYFVIAEGTVDRHVIALYFAIKDSLDEVGITPYHVEGQHDGDWIVMDYTDFVIHLFIPDIREKYALEKLWKESKIVDVNIVTEREKK